MQFFLTVTAIHWKAIIKMGPLKKDLWTCFIFSEVLDWILGYYFQS